MLSNKLYSALQDKPDLIGLGGLCIDYSFLKDAIAIIRNLEPDIPIVLGGNIVSKDAEFIFNQLKPNYCIKGEAEETLVQLADRHNFYGISNLGFWDDGNAVFTKENFDYGDINDRPFPDYDVFGMKEMVDDYSQATRILYRYPRPYPKVMPIVTARSCPFSCTFCIHTGGATYRARSIENIMQEIEELYTKYGFNILIIGDELFAASKKRMREFCDALIAKKQELGWDFDWMFQTHASAKLDADTLALARKSGCYFFSYGIESASPKVLKSMNKKITIPQIEEAIGLAHEANIGFGGNLIFGDIAETDDTIYETLAFFEKYGHDDHIFLSTLQPYPGSKLFDICIKKGIIPDRLKYYETIGKVLYNMSETIPNSNWHGWVNFFSIYEQLWIGVKSTRPTSVEKEDYTDPIIEYTKQIMHKVQALCPHCGEEIIYRQIWDYTPRFMGTGCTKCNRRIKIKLK